MLKVSSLRPLDLCWELSDPETIQEKRSFDRHVSKEFVAS
jgi:hypothetical protein